MERGCPRPRRRGGRGGRWKGLTLVRDPSAEKGERERAGERERESLGAELNPSVSSSSGTAAASSGSPGARWSLAASPSLCMTVILVHTAHGGGGHCCGELGWVGGPVLAGKGNLKKKIENKTKTKKKFSNKKKVKKKKKKKQPCGEKKKKKPSPCDNTGPRRSGAPGGVREPPSSLPAALRSFKTRPAPPPRFYSPLAPPPAAPASQWERAAPRPQPMGARDAAALAGGPRALPVRAEPRAPSAPA